MLEKVWITEGNVRAAIQSQLSESRSEYKM